MTHVARAFPPQSIIEDESVENDSPMRKITHKADSPAFPFPHWVERPATPCVHTMWFTGGGQTLINPVAAAATQSPSLGRRHKACKYRVVQKV